MFLTGKILKTEKIIKTKNVAIIKPKLHRIAKEKKILQIFLHAEVKETEYFSLHRMDIMSKIIMYEGNHFLRKIHLKCTSSRLQKCKKYISTSDINF